MVRIFYFIFLVVVLAAGAVSFGPRLAAAQTGGAAHMAATDCGQHGPQAQGNAACDACLMHCTAARPEAAQQVSRPSEARPGAFAVMAATLPASVGGEAPERPPKRAML